MNVVGLENTIFRGEFCGQRVVFIYSGRPEQNSGMAGQLVVAKVARYIAIFIRNLMGEFRPVQARLSMEL